MRVVQIHNITRFDSGGTNQVNDMAAMLEQRGVHISWLTRSSKGLDATLAGKFRAFANGIYSPSA